MRKVETMFNNKYYNQDLYEIKRLKEMMIAELMYYTSPYQEIENLDFQTLAQMCSECLPIEEE